jgi:hypothetical protein
MPEGTGRMEEWGDAKTVEEVLDRSEEVDGIV